MRPSGNLAERGLRKTAELTMSEFPRAHEVILNDIYVDDCFSGQKLSGWKSSNNWPANSCSFRRGFTLKGFTFSGMDPPEHLSNDGKSVIVGGLKWYPKEDLISITVGELNFAKKNQNQWWVYSLRK